MSERRHFVSIGIGTAPALRGGASSSASARAGLLLALWLASSTVQAQVCIDDSDCESGLRCALRDSDVCVDRPGQPPDCSPPQEGECEPAPIACDADADCPLGLRCETERTVEECAATPAAGDGEPDDRDPGESCTTMEVAVPEPRCVFELVACAQDDECERDFSCQAIGREEDCSAPANCAPGETCPPPEPVCTEQAVNYCFPVRMDCTQDADCDAGWQCSELPEDAQDDPPAGWEGASGVCFPDGLVLFLEGRVPAGRNTSGESADTSEGRAGADGAREDDAAPDGASSDGLDASGSCSVRGGAPKRGGAALLGIVLLTLALLLVRRRA